jgi:hypothetical protein
MSDLDRVFPKVGGYFTQVSRIVKSGNKGHIEKVTKEMLDKRYQIVV